MTKERKGLNDSTAIVIFSLFVLVFTLVLLIWYVSFQVWVLVFFAVYFAVAFGWHGRGLVDQHDKETSRVDSRSNPGDVSG
jgi:fatty acid desaturase